MKKSLRRRKDKRRKDKRKQQKDAHRGSPEANKKDIKKVKVSDHAFIVMSYQNIATCDIYSNDTHSIIYRCLKENRIFTQVCPF